MDTEVLLLELARRAQHLADHYTGEGIDRAIKMTYHQGRANAYREAAGIVAIDKRPYTAPPEDKP